MVTGLGAITMAAHEILRQVWILSIQAFMALDITAQSLVASYLGQVMLQSPGHVHCPVVQPALQLCCIVL